MDDCEGVVDRLMAALEGKPELRDAVKARLFQAERAVLSEVESLLDARGTIDPSDNWPMRVTTLQASEDEVYAVLQKVRDVLCNIEVL